MRLVGRECCLILQDLHLKIGMSNAELTLEETKSLDRQRTKKRLTEDLSPQ
jgi:hypothetical protein